MDTASHILFGVSLAGLAGADSAMASAGMPAVLTAVVLASNAPDFDAVFRLRGTNAYLRNHRGITHSLPALLLWPAAITAAVVPMFGVYELWWKIGLWSVVGVFLHVFLDLLNTYGVQCLRPLSGRWLHLDILCIFEPLLFALHLIGVVLWLAGAADPGLVLVWVYAISAVYVACRAAHHHVLVRKVRMELGELRALHVIPTLHPLQWRVVAETEERLLAGTIQGLRMEIVDQYAKEPYPEAVKVSLGVDGVRAFLSFAQRVHVTCTENRESGGYIVRWSDVRFWHASSLAFGADVQLDPKLRVVGEKVGWRKKKWHPPYI